jgi:hypothetical protein
MEGKNIGERAADFYCKKDNKGIFILQIRPMLTIFSEETGNSCLLKVKLLF